MQDFGYLVEIARAFDGNGCCAVMVVVMVVVLLAPVLVLA